MRLSLLTYRGRGDIEFFLRNIVDFVKIGEIVNINSYLN